MQYITTMDIRLENRNYILLLAIEYKNTNPEAPIRQVAEDFGVSFATLWRQLGKPTTARIGQEGNQRLSFRQERWLAEWIISEEARGYAPGHARFREMVIYLLQAGGDFKPLGKRWVDAFRNRHEDIKTLIGKRLSDDRFDSVTPAILNAHFDAFSAIKAEYSIKDENIYNMDETGTPIGASATNNRVLGLATPISTKKKVKKTTKVKTSSNREWVTIIEAIGASGRAIKPVIIFKGASVQLQWFPAAGTPDWIYTTSMNGWTSNCIGVWWLENVFEPETRPANADEWRMLVLDGHKSHVSIEFMISCKNHRIYCHWLPPHTSHITQPLDLSCFSPIKGAYKTEIAALAALDDNAQIKKMAFIACY
jgi:DDE superfamily endonuclease/Tc5 transposase DNA-binding domain